jgi:hypothetical protein
LLTVHPPFSTPHKGPWRHGRRCKKIATNGEDGELIEEVNAYFGGISLAQELKRVVPVIRSNESQKLPP